MLPVLRRGSWRLSELADVPKNGRKVFSTFHCGGGSTMGYKLAGYDVLGGVEIDPKMMAIYRQNHKPQYSYLMNIVDFNALQDEELPKELFGIDILDGSPPCSSFSTVGARDKGWGKLKMFREGQAVQVLDDLFGHFLVTVNKLRPKVVVAENVKGMLRGNAKGYVREIIKAFQTLGYSVQLFLFNASRMGVPQKRERVFFIANRIGKQCDMMFDEKTISLQEAFIGIDPGKPKLLTQGTVTRRNWTRASIGGSFGSSRSEGITSEKKSHPELPAMTLTATKNLYHWSEPRNFQDQEINIIQSFPSDFDFLKMDRTYICGMSVPPFMMQRIAQQIYLQCFASSGAAEASYAI
jgi:DNA (cytosine-5)-methyltransferase 1